MSTYSVAQINAAMADPSVVACRKAIEDKKNEIASYDRQIDRMTTQINDTTTRKTATEARKTTAESELAALETQLESDMNNALSS